MSLSPETEAILARMKPGKFVWCQSPEQRGSVHDEHQVCIDQEASHYAKGFKTWACTCKCHR
jgi:hypothetical protein